jgi:hypothetical protein
MSNTIRLEILDFINALQNEVMVFEHDQEVSAWETEPGIVEKMRATIAVLERLFPMVQCVDEVLCGDITPKVFWKKWENVKGHFDFPDDDIDETDISSDVRGFLSKFDSGEGEEA